MTHEFGDSKIELKSNKILTNPSLKGESVKKYITKYRQQTDSQSKEK